MKKNNKVSFDKRCLICVDLDGTLLNNKSQLTPYTIKVIKKLTSMGHIVSINTARPYNAIYRWYRLLGLTTPISCHNGAMMFNPCDDDFGNTNWCLSKEIIKEIISDKEVMSHYLNGLIDAEKTAYIIGKNSLSKAEAKKAIETVGIYIGDDIKTLENINNFKDTAYGLILYPKTKESTMDLVNAIKCKVPTVITSLWRVDQDTTLVKVCSPFCSKAMAGSLISAYYGIPPQRCYAFGDGLDDADMLLYASNGYAMRNGSNEAQVKANFITKYTNDQDGVARELNRIFKLRFKK